MRPPRKSSRREIYLEVGPPQLAASRSRGSSTESRAYEVLIYSNMPELGEPTGELRDAPPEVGGLRLLGVEQIRLRWNSYAEYLELFLHAEKAPLVMRERLYEALSGRLEAIFGGSFGDDVRIWFHGRSPELDELPWELLAFGHSGPRCSFVRGVPGPFAPLTPVTLPLKMGLIGAARAEPLIRDVLCNLGQGAPIDVKDLGVSIREGARQAVGEQCELLHVVSDGDVTAGLDGLLVGDGESVSPRELRSLLADSRIGVAALSRAAPREEGAGPTRVHRAFAHVGADIGTAATLVAPIGPMPSDRAAQFWGQFYVGLAGTLSVEKAMLSAQRQLAGSAAPIAIFLAHRLGTQFVARSGFESATEIDPPRLNAQIASVRSFVDQLSRIGARYEAPEAKAQLESMIERGKQQLDDADESLDVFRGVEGEPR
jgi:hypothetical protein